MQLIVDSILKIQKIFIVFLLIYVALSSALLFRFLSGDEDTWICQKGEWVVHGVPSASKPHNPC